MAIQGELEPDALHISKGEAPFTARMRVHQSWYRKYVLKRPPGPNPAARGQLYGNILRPEDGTAGLNFLTDMVRAAVEARLDQGSKGIEQKRLRCNMLGSQPMCFNLFGPLALDCELATGLMARLPGFPVGSTVTEIRFEYAPDRKSHLKDDSAFDAFVEYRRPDGRKGFYGVETKLTEPFSQKKYSYREGYSRWNIKSGWWWNPGEKERFSDLRYNQLWRNHLLAFAILNQPGNDYAEGRCAVIWHPGDTACTEAINAYRRCLQKDAEGTLVEWPLDKVVTQWEGTGPVKADCGWLAAFRRRYLTLEESEAVWKSVVKER